MQAAIVTLRNIRVMDMTLSHLAWHNVKKNRVWFPQPPIWLLL